MQIVSDIGRTGQASELGRQWRPLLTPQRSEKVRVDRRTLEVVYKASGVLDNVAVAACTVGDVGDRRRMLLRRWVVILRLGLLAEHHVGLADRGQSTVVQDYVRIAAGTIPGITGILGIEGASHTCLNLVRRITFCRTRTVGCSKIKGHRNEIKLILISLDSLQIKI